MLKTSNSDTDMKIAVDINALQEMLSVGRNTAAKIGVEAGSVIRIGKRRLYNVSRIQAYMDSITEDVV